MRRLGGFAMAWVFATVVAVAIAAAAVGSVRSEVTDVPTPLGVSASPAITAGISEDEPESPDDTSELTTDSATSTTSSTVTTVASIQESTVTTGGVTTTRGGEPDESVIPQQEASPEEASTSPPPAEPAASSPGAATTIPTTPTTTRPTDRVAATPTTIAVTTTTAQQTTTTIPAVKSYTRVIDTIGGSLSVRVNGDTIAFRRAYPNTGWRFQLGSGGPDAVEAHFTRSGGTTMTIKVKATVVNGDLKVTTSAMKLTDLDT